MIGYNDDGTVAVTVNGEQLSGTLAEVVWALGERGLTIRDITTADERAELEGRMRYRPSTPPAPSAPAPKRSRKKEA